MKRKLLSLLLIFALAISLVGCGKDNKSEKKSKKKTEATDSKDKKSKKEEKNDASSANNSDASAAPEVAEATEVSESDNTHLSDSEIMQFGDLITDDLYTFEFYLLGNYYPGQEFNDYLKGVLAVTSAGEQDLIGTIEADMLEIYEIPYDSYMDSLTRHLGSNTVTDIPKHRGESEFFIQVIHDSDEDYLMYLDYCENETDYEVLSKTVGSFEEDGTTYYKYTKNVYYGYWGETDREPNLAITYVLSVDPHSEYGVLIEDIYTNQYIGDIEPVSESEANDIIERDAQFVLEFYPDGCYAIFVGAFKNFDDAMALAKDVEAHRIVPMILLTSEWENLNSEPYYAVCTDTAGTEEMAEDFISVSKEFYPDAYIKFTGKRK